MLLSEMLQGRKAYAPLEENHAYTALLKDYVVTPAEEPTDDNKGTIAFKLELEDGRTISHMCRVPVGVDIFTRQLLAQTGMPNATDQATVITSVLQNKTPLKMWVTHNDSYTNYTFVAPKVANTATETEEFN
jgi:hypothetical protein